MYICYETNGRIYACVTHIPSEGFYIESNERISTHNHYVHNEQILPMPEIPSKFHVFNYDMQQWVDARTLEELKVDRWINIKSAREASIDAPLQTPYGIFDSDATARSNISDAVLLVQTLQSIGQSAGIDFTLANNTVVTLTQSEMITVGLLLGQKVQQARGIATALRAELDSATTPAEVEAITWPST